MDDSSSGDVIGTMSRRWRLRWYRVLGGLLLCLFCFVGYGIWKSPERLTAIKLCEANGGSVDYLVVYPNWVRVLGIENWFNEKSFIKIDTLEYASDADLQRMASAFNLSQLETLIPLNAEECSAEGLEPLSRFSGLKNLSLKGDMITPEILRQSAELRYLLVLILESGKLDDESLLQLASQPSLVTLGIEDCDIKSVSPGTFNRIPNLASLWFSSMKLSDSDLAGFSQLNRLLRLGLHQVDLSPAGFAELGRLPLLANLEVYDSPVTPEKLARFVAARQPQHVNYRHNRLSGMVFGRTPPNCLMLPDTWRFPGANTGPDDMATSYSIYDATRGPIPHGDRMWISCYSEDEPELIAEELSVLVQDNHFESLSISNVSMTSRLEETLAGSSNLQELILLESSLSDETLKRLNNSLPNCKIQYSASATLGPPGIRRFGSAMDGEGLLHVAPTRQDAD